MWLIIVVNHNHVCSVNTDSWDAEAVPLEWLHMKCTSKVSEKKILHLYIVKIVEKLWVRFSWRSWTASCHSRALFVALGAPDHNSNSGPGASKIPPTKQRSQWEMFQLLDEFEHYELQRWPHRVASPISSNKISNRINRTCQVLCTFAVIINVTVFEIKTWHPNSLQQSQPQNMRSSTESNKSIFLVLICSEALKSFPWFWCQRSILTLHWCL